MRSCRKWCTFPNKRRLIWVMVFVGVVVAIVAVGLSTLMQSSEPAIETTVPQTVSSLRCFDRVKLEPCVLCRGASEKRSPPCP